MLLGSSEIPMEVWALFKDMLERPDLPVQNVLEIVEKAVSGCIDMENDFNLFGYDFAIQKGRIKTQRAKLKKETFIDFSDVQKDRSDAKEIGGANINVISFQADALSDSKSEFDELFDNAELRSAVETIKALNDDFITEFQVDLIALIKKAVRGVPQAVLKLKKVCEEVVCVGEQVKIILSANVSVEECFA